MPVSRQGIDDGMYELRTVEAGYRHHRGDPGGAVDMVGHALQRRDQEERRQALQDDEEQRIVEQPIERDDQQGTGFEMIL